MKRLKSGKHFTITFIDLTVSGGLEERSQRMKVKYDLRVTRGSSILTISYSPLCQVNLNFPFIAQNTNM